MIVAVDEAQTNMGKDQLTPLTKNFKDLSTTCDSEKNKRIDFTTVNFHWRLKSLLK